jgi:DNA repair exonuclease SbcCD ATPase subunit
MRAAAAGRAAAAARLAQPGNTVRNAIVVAGVLAFCVAIGFAIAHSWTWTGVAATLAIAGLASAFAQHRERAERVRNATEKQRLADEASAADEAASNAVTSVIDPLGLGSFEELLARRSRLADLLARKRNADAAIARARSARFAAEQTAARFDRLCGELVPGIDGDRTARKAAANARAARKRERDGLAAHLHALEMRKSTILGSDDEYTLEAELAELQRNGVEPSDEDAGARRAIESERIALAEQLRATRDLYSRLAGELAGAQAQIPDLAALDEDLARTQGEIARLEAFERAVLLAKSSLELRTQEAHRAFARRLEDYAADTLAAITNGRYAQIFVDPSTLTIRVRIPETQAIADLDSVSAGTRDQTYLVVRFAMARMFAEGIETPPLLLDDPFAYWDATRIERCLPIVQHGARGAQAILFTASRELADAAERGGAHRVDLPEPALV